MLKGKRQGSQLHGPGLYHCSAYALARMRFFSLETAPSPPAWLSDVQPETKQVASAFAGTTFATNKSEGRALGMIDRPAQCPLRSDELTTKIDQFKNGHGPFLVQGHNVVLGWNKTAVPLLQQVKLHRLLSCPIASLAP